MIILQNSIITLEYSPATDILEVKYPDLQGFMLHEIQETFNLMVEAIRNYDVKKLLIDASTTAIEISDEENTALSFKLANALANTRLLKLARIQPLDVKREHIAQENIHNMEKAGILSYQLRTFSNKESALNWLKS